MKRVLWVAGILAVGIGIRAAQSLVAFKNQDTRMAHFETVMGDYLALKTLPVTEGEPYIRGRLVTVDVDQGIVDTWTYPKLSETLRATSPDEVGTVGLILWDWRRIGAYVDQETQRETGEAFISTARLVLVDLADRKVITHATFEGDAPAGGQTREGDYRSERPMFKIVEYLESLPRR